MTTGIGLVPDSVDPARLAEFRGASLSSGRPPSPPKC